MLMLFLLFIAGVYILIPRKLDLSDIVLSNCTPSGAWRLVSEQTQWASWQPAAGGGNLYTITKKLYNGLEINIQHGNLQAGSLLHFIGTSNDSLMLAWQCIVPISNNPFTRIAQYNKAMAMKKNMHAALAHLAFFLSDTKNVYGYSIQRTSTVDTLLVATRSVFLTQPATPDVYRLAATLKKYTAAQGAKQTGPPIMNVTQQDDDHFQLMVALPTDRPLAGDKNIFFRKMVPGAFMVADVTGGDHSVVHAMEQMRLYFDDYKKTAMAIPFAALITDRMQEPDTTRWVTRIYAPVY